MKNTFAQFVVFIVCLVGATAIGIQIRPGLGSIVGMLVGIWAGITATQAMERS